MKVAPVSGDLLVKLAMGALAVGALVLLARKAAAMTPSSQQILDAVRAAGDAVNPASTNNLVYRGVNSAVSAATGRDETLGGWLYDATHADPMQAPPATSGQVTPDQVFSSPGGFYSQPGVLF